jgi:DNA mismatch repair ATPase MutS
MKKNILAENMKRFATKNLTEVDTYIANAEGPFNTQEIKIYEKILDALEVYMPQIPASIIDDFTDEVNKQYYTTEFKKIIDSIKTLGGIIEDDMNDRSE